MLAKDPVEVFIEKLSGASAAPGGGSASALASSMAAALAAMVAGLTELKKGYEDYREDIVRIREDAHPTCKILANLTDKDSDAYTRVFDAFKMPKDTDEEKAARSRVIQEATEHAARVPLETMKYSVETLEHLKYLAEFGNRNARTDVAVGAMLAKTGLEGAYRNVAVNLDSLKNRETVGTLQTQAERLLAAGRELADRALAIIDEG